MRNTTPALVAAASLFVLTSATSASAADVPSSGPKATDETGPGNVAQLSAGMSYLGGQAAQDAAIGGVQAVFAFRGGHFFGQHVGLLAGVELGHGFMTAGCVATATGKESTDCKTFTASVPLVVEYTFLTRSRGAWIEAGAALGKTFLASGASDSLLVVSPADAAVGFGTRVPVIGQQGAPPRTLDFAARGEAGMFMFGSYTSDTVNVGGEIPTDRRAMHYALTLSMAYQF